MDGSRPWRPDYPAPVIAREADAALRAMLAEPCDASHGSIPVRTFPPAALPDFLQRGFRLMLQKNPESKSMRNQQQRHYQSRKEVCGSQLTRQ